MKRFLLISILVSLIGASYHSMAQSRGHSHRHDTPTVYIISSGGDGGYYDEQSLQQAMERRSLAAEATRADFEQTRTRGFQQLHNPQFIFSTKNNRFSLGIGGEINFRTSYDLKGAVDNIDFVPYDIPMDATYANRQRVMMDATTSRLYTKAVINSEKLGRIVAFVDMDFRGGEEFSYTPRLRSA